MNIDLNENDGKFRMPLRYFADALIGSELQSLHVFFVFFAYHPFIGLDVLLKKFGFSSSLKGTTAVPHLGLESKNSKLFTNCLPEIPPIRGPSNSRD